MKTVLIYEDLGPVPDTALNALAAKTLAKVLDELDDDDGDPLMYIRDALDDARGLERDRIRHAKVTQRQGVTRDE